MVRLSNRFLNLVAAACAAATFFPLHAHAAPVAAYSKLLPELSADEDTTRRHALKSLQSLLLSQDAASLTSPAAASFNARLDAWLIELSKLPPEQRQPQVQLLNHPDLLPILANLFSDNPQSRIAGLHSLATHADLPIAPLLLYSVRDSTLSVSLAALDALWDMKPTDDLIQPLWNMAIGNDLEDCFTPRGMALPTASLTFRGDPVSDSPGNLVDAPPPFGSFAINSTCAVAASQVLAHLKGKTLENLLQQALTRIADHDPGRQINTVAAITDLTQQTAAASTLPALYHLATLPVPEQKARIGRYRSIRTFAIVALVRLTGQDPATYGLSPAGGPLLSSFPTQADENNAIAKLTTWWTEHPDHAVVATVAAIETPATQPAPLAPTDPTLLQCATPLIARGAEMLKVDDPDALNYVDSLLQYDLHLSHWLTTVAQLPADDKAAELRLLQLPDLSPIFANVFSDAPVMRVAGIRELATHKDAKMDRLLANIASQDDAVVVLAAMEVLWDRPADSQTIKTLWTLGILNNFSRIFSAPSPFMKSTIATIPFHGQNLPGQLPRIFTSIFASLDARSSTARKVLLHFKGPDADSLMTQTLTDLTQKFADPAMADTHRTIEFMRALTSLASFVQDLHAPATFPALFTFATNPTQVLPNSTTKAFTSTRTAAITALIALTGQKSADYQLQQRIAGGDWNFPTEAAETDAIDKLKTWWSTHSTDFVASPAPATAAVPG